MNNYKTPLPTSIEGVFGAVQIKLSHFGEHVFLIY